MFSSGFQILRAETAAAGTFAKTLGVNLGGCSSRDPSKLHGGCLSCKQFCLTVQPPPRRRFDARLRFCSAGCFPAEPASASPSTRRNATRAGAKQILRARHEERGTRRPGFRFRQRDMRRKTSHFPGLGVDLSGNRPSSASMDLIAIAAGRFMPNPSTVPLPQGDRPTTHYSKVHEK